MFVIKPSGVPYAELTPAHMVPVSLDTGAVIERRFARRPTRRRTSSCIAPFACGAIVHTHSEFATLFAQARTPIRCMGTTHADYFRGDVPVTRR